MRRVASSAIAREQLLAGALEREANIVFALLETVTRLVVQQLLVAKRTGLPRRPGPKRPPQRRAGRIPKRRREGPVANRRGLTDVAVPQLHGAAGAAPISLMGWLFARQQRSLIAHGCPACEVVSSRVHAWTVQRGSGRAARRRVEVVVRKPRLVCAEPACRRRTFTHSTGPAAVLSRCRWCRPLLSCHLFDRRRCQPSLFIWLVRPR
jgi:hypothetical protein